MSTGTVNRWLTFSLSIACMAWLIAFASVFWELFLCTEKAPLTSAEFELYPSCGFRSVPGLLTAWALACVAGIGGGVGYFRLRSKRAIALALPAWLLALPPVPFLIWYVPGLIAKNVL